MNKFRFICQDNQLFLKKKLTAAQIINESEANLLITKYMPGILCPTYIDAKQIVLFCPSGMSLNKFLSKTIDKSLFFLIVAQVLEAHKRVEENRLQFSNLILDMNYVFVNEATFELNFIYLPIFDKQATISMFSIVSMLSFLEDIMRNTKADGSYQFLNDFVSFLNGSGHRSFADIEAYIVRNQPNVYQRISAIKSGQTGFAPQTKQEYTHPPFTNQNLYSGQNEGTTLLEKDEGTTILSGSDSTTVLSENTAVEAVSHPYLIRIKTNEKIMIDKPVYRIGKEKKYVDYFVSDNNAVSRSHADIIKRDRKNFIYDNNSTNKTYVNGNAIPVQQETEIFDSDQIVLGNEAFEFKEQ